LKAGTAASVLELNATWNTEDPSLLATGADRPTQPLAMEVCFQGGTPRIFAIEPQGQGVQWHGVPMKKPLTRVKETTIMVRSMLAGEKSNFDLSTLYSKGYSQAPLEEEVPIYLAALRPKMIEMAAEIGDGVIFNMWPKEALPKMIEHVHIGAERAGKDPNEVEVVNRYLVLVTDDKEAAVEAFRARMAPYYATPVYNDFLAWAGYADVAETISEGWAERDREKTMGALSFDLANEIAVIGTADECRERIRWAGETGIHTHIIAPLPAAAEDVQRTFEAFTPENFPR
ncbi:MAG: LLM class flavin-dependent oxidoreductase, partial [Rhodospirillaceae bacterium]|nr:LLM class flavin-dependent oxidoreductase [Rhodospirillaceae bacterium]